MEPRFKLFSYSIYEKAGPTYYDYEHDETYEDYDEIVLNYEPTRKELEDDLIELLLDIHAGKETKEKRVVYEEAYRKMLDVVDIWEFAELYIDDLKDMIEERERG